MSWLGMALWRTLLRQLLGTVRRSKNTSNMSLLGDFWVYFHRLIVLLVTVVGIRSRCVGCWA